VRWSGRLKMGYFPLPVSEAQRLRKFLLFPGQSSSVLDPCVGDGGAFEAITSGKTPAEVDDVVQYPLLWKPGDLATSEDYPADVRNDHKRIFGEPTLDLDSFLHARVRSRSGIVAGLQVKHRGSYSYTSEVRTIIATLADLASLALS